MRRNFNVTRSVNGILVSDEEVKNYVIRDEYITGVIQRVQTNMNGFQQTTIEKKM